MPCAGVGSNVPTFPDLTDGELTVWCVSVVSCGDPPPHSPPQSELNITKDMAIKTELERLDVPLPGAETMLRFKSHATNIPRK